MPWITRPRETGAGEPLRRIDLYLVQLHSKVLGYLSRVRQIIRHPDIPNCARIDREALDVRRYLPRHRHYRTGVQPAGKKGANRHIRHHLPMHGSAQSGLDAANRLVRIQR
jgi:hypothetical protein